MNKLYKSKINNYKIKSIQLMCLRIDLKYNSILQIATKIADLRLRNYILENNQQSIKDMITQTKILLYLMEETKKRENESTCVEESCMKYITQINECKKKECYICYESAVLYNFYECNHSMCSVCYYKIVNKKCSYCSSKPKHNNIELEFTNY